MLTQRAAGHRYFVHWNRRTGALPPAGGRVGQGGFNAPPGRSDLPRLPIIAAAMLALCGAAFAQKHNQDRFKPKPMTKDAISAELRKAIGLDAKTMAILDVDKEDFRNAVKQSIVQSQEQRAELEPMAKEMARLEQTKAMPLNRKDPAAFRTAHKEHTQAVGRRAAPWARDIEAKMSADGKRAFANVATNVGLDPELRLLTLTDEQREALWRATLERDEILQSPAYMHNSAKCEYAMKDYDEAVPGILTREQNETLAGYKRKIEERWADMLMAEVAAFEETKDSGN
ncbi:MAG: hypothetical protein IT449_15385 [Phycisphaerales bacterium]|nr:hypothetical protein [Phycisphaerales bacterium]